MKTTKYSILQNGIEVYTGLTESECFDRMQDFAIEFYLTGKNDPNTFKVEMIEDEE